MGDGTATHPPLHRRVTRTPGPRRPHSPSRARCGTPRATCTRTQSRTTGQRGPRGTTSRGNRAVCLCTTCCPRSCAKNRRECARRNARRGGEKYCASHAPWSTSTWTRGGYGGCEKQAVQGRGLWQAAVVWQARRSARVLRVPRGPGAHQPGPGGAEGESREGVRWGRAQPPHTHATRTAHRSLLGGTHQRPVPSPACLRVCLCAATVWRDRRRDAERRATERAPPARTQSSRLTTTFSSAVGGCGRPGCARCARRFRFARPSARPRQWPNATRSAAGR